MIPFPVTYIIIGITLLFSIPAMNNPELKGKLMFNAYAVRHKREWYRLFTHALIHADWMHLIMNMYVLYGFGVITEGEYAYYFQEKAVLFYILLYVGAIFMSSVYSYEKHKDNMYYNALGASGAVSAILFAHILINPTAGISFIFIPFAFPGWVLGGLYLIYSWYMGKKGNDNIGHDAHFWGAVYGVAFTLCLKPGLAAIFVSQITGHGRG
jgi:membrane associated rhomboid family serine protease